MGVDTKPPRRYELDVKELKLALHKGVMAACMARKQRINPRGYVHAEVTYDPETDRVIGAVVWYTRRPVDDEETKNMVKV